MSAEKKDIVRDNRSGKVYWDTGLIRTFEKVLKEDVTWEDAKKEHPAIIDPHKA